MKRPYVQCGLCGSFVKLTKAGTVPEHAASDWPGNRRRCNGISHRLRIGLAAQEQPWHLRQHRHAHKRARRYHAAGKSVANDPLQRGRWLYRNGWLPEQQQRIPVMAWRFATKYGRAPW